VKITAIHVYQVDLPLIEGNSNHLQQVFMNLLGNAQQALDGKPGRIAIQTALDSNGLLEITVRDTGPGIPEELQQRIFEPFYTTKRAGQGTGLGLSVSYGIIQKHHGSIAVRSAADQGTVFAITLPPQNEASRLGVEFA